jgi:hypothetical protein
MGPRLRQLLPVAAFTATYLAPAAIIAVLNGNAEFVFYVVVMLILIGAVWLLDRRIELSMGALWSLSAWGLAHMGGGLLPIPDSWPANSVRPAVLYNLWLIPERIKYDQLVHAFGFGVTTWICWQGLSVALRSRGIEPRPTAGLLLLCAAAGMGFGALNEVIEFAAVLLVPETNVGGYRNTGWDLVANLAGATVAAFCIRFGRASE